MYIGECLSISSLPSKASITLVESQGQPSGSTCDLQAEPGKLDIKTREPGILFISLQVCKDYDIVIDFRIDSTSLTTSFKSTT